MDAGHRRPRWWPVVLGGTAVAVSVFVLLSRWDAVWASHPAFLVAVAVTGLLGLAWLLWGVLRRPGGPASRPVLVWVGRVLTTVIVVFWLGVLVWLRPFTATEVAVDAMRSDAIVTVSDPATRIELSPTGDERPTGLVFYPGARVDPRAYVAILRPLAEAGYLVVVVKPPLGIALVDRGAAGDVIDDHPEIGQWVVGGHSLGGTAAASFAGERRPEVTGLLLWASYPASSIADRHLAVTSVSGTDDGLATPDDIEGSVDELPPSTRFVPVDGAIHAHIGDYGTQPGDGEPAISREDAQAQIRAASLALLASVSG